MCLKTRCDRENLNHISRKQCLPSINNTKNIFTADAFTLKKDQTALQHFILILIETVLRNADFIMLVSK